MSEFTPKMPEIDISTPEISKSELSPERKAEKETSNPEKSNEKSVEDLSKIRHKVEHLAHSKSESKIDKPQSNHAPQTIVNKQLKQEMLDKTIKRVQKKLPPVQRTLSKVVHNKTVDKISNAGEKTVARPIGILGGGILALIGSIFSTYLSKQFGLPYNMLVFILLFVIGYALASLLEIIFRLVKHSKAK